MKPALIMTAMVFCCLLPLAVSKTNHSPSFKRCFYLIYACLTFGLFACGIGFVFLPTDTQEKWAIGFRLISYTLGVVLLFNAFAIVPLLRHATEWFNDGLREANQANRE